MQTYHHQQIANLNLPNGSGPGLLVATSQHNQQLQHHQMLQQQQSNHAYQDLVKAYLPTMSNNCNGMVGLTSVSPSMTSFAVRLMSLNAHELRCLSSDSELMRHIDKAQTLIDSRLQDINAPEQFASNAGANQQQQQQQQQQQMFASSQLNFAMKHPQHEHLILSSHDNYYRNFYVQQLASNQQQQQQQQQQANQLLLMASRYHEQNSSNTNCLVGSSITNRQHLPIQNTDNQATSLNASALAPDAGALDATLQSIMNVNQQAPTQNGLDLRTTPRPTSAISTTPSPNRAGSTGSGNSRYTGSQHPKKLKLTEYRRLQQLAEQATAEQRHIRQYQESNDAPAKVNEPNENDPHVGNGLPPQELQAKRTYQDDNPPESTNTRSEHQKATTNMHNSSLGVKKYKGEFDEPSLEEVAARERQLHKPGHYHTNRECACVIGSEFRHKTPTEALELLEHWRALDIDERVKWKWDVDDLPKDIPLSDIKKFEDLRRDYSRGRADFGGASKRKPLSIRGTRQFLLMLYCLHGHPGRDDTMQKEGYCPHCFAKIRTENEQSTLVRVVNHFNMKHRRGANPRLSPHLEANQRTPTVASPPAQSPTPIRETLMSMVESAVASVETGNEEPASGSLDQQIKQE